MLSVRLLSNLAAVILVALAGLVSCKDPASGEAAAAEPPDDSLARVGSITISQRDLDQQLGERHSGRTDEATRRIALDELVRRARFAQAALDAGLGHDPVVRSETGRLLEARFRERELAPRLQEQLAIPPARLEAIYQAEISRFQTPEKREVAVLWLDSGIDPERVKRDGNKMREARNFIMGSKDLLDHPEKGFSILGADYSEHQASRYRGGILGWLEHKGGMEPWTKAVAEIAFSLGAKGDVSEVTARPEGVFLVRVMDLHPALTRSFESVAGQLEREERARLAMDIEDRFAREIESRYPVQWIGG